VPLAVAPLVVLRDMGPLPGTSLRHTVWHRGMRMVVYGPNTPLRAADFSIPGQMITVVPEGYAQNQEVLAKATTIIIKFAPGELVPNTASKPGTIMNWTVDNIVAYSKICTHVGCPVALYDQTTHHILCPCHQSTFDATAGAQVLFGPAPRPLPQLPIGVDSSGFLVAASDFHEPVGPAFWEMG
jgi:ubiquinol-cytochrome c reductase iron-sulfur subunit